MTSFGSVRPDGTFVTTGMRDTRGAEERRRDDALIRSAADPSFQERRSPGRTSRRGSLEGRVTPVPSDGQGRGTPVPSDGRRQRAPVQLADGHDEAFMEEMWGSESDYEDETPEVVAKSAPKKKEKSMSERRRSFLKTNEYIKTAGLALLILGGMAASLGLMGTTEMQHLPKLGYNLQTYLLLGGAGGMAIGGGVALNAHLENKQVRKKDDEELEKANTARGQKRISNNQSLEKYTSKTGREYAVGKKDVTAITKDEFGTVRITKKGKVRRLKSQ